MSHSDNVAVPPLIWHQDCTTLLFIALRYLPWLAALNLVWEIAQLRLYTLWTDSPPRQIAYAIAHCTLGDIAIGGAALIMALIITRAGNIETWQWARIAAMTTLLGTSYTIFSEWMNVVALQSWSYSKLMPVIPLGGFEIGISPLLQWLLIPSLVLLFARHRSRQARSRDSSCA